MSDIKKMLTTWVDNETWVDSKNLTAINNVAVQMADDIEVLSRVAATTHSEVEAINEVMVGAEVYTDNSIEVEFPTLDRDMREVKEQVESIQTSLDNKANLFKINREYENHNYLIGITYQRNGMDRTALRKIIMYISNDGYKFNKVATIPTNLPYEIYDISTIWFNNEFIIMYDYIDKDFNDWTEENTLYNRGGNRIGILKTKDFINFTQQNISLPLEWKSTWAPEPFIENNEMYISLTTSSCTDTFTTIDGATRYIKDKLWICKLNSELNGIVSKDEIEIDLTNKIDPFILKENGVYYLAIKNENTCKNVVYKSNSLLNGYSKIKEFDDIAEGISIIKFNDKYYTYVSIYNANHTLGNGIGNGLYMSNDLVNWSELTQIKNSGDSINRHFTPMVITTEQQKTIVNNFLKMYGNDTLVDFEKNKSYILANANENKTHNNLLLDPNATYSVSGTSTVTINQLDTSLLKTGDLVHFFIRNNGGSICFKYNSNNKVWWSDTNDFNVTGENGFGCTVITLICNKNGEAYFNTTSDKNIIKTVSVGNGLTLKLTKKNGVVIGNISGNTTLFANTDVGVNNIIPTGFRPSYTSAFVSTQSINGSHPINGLTIKTDGRIEYFSTEERSNTWFICNFSYICS